jgi:hypothetical protein
MEKFNHTEEISLEKNTVEKVAILFDLVSRTLYTPLFSEPKSE